MFRRIAYCIPDDANTVFRQHPSVLTAALELAWQRRRDSLSVDLGRPERRSNIASLPDDWLLKLPGIKAAGERCWDHLIYAYMIENTRIYEIFRRVLYEFLHGEKLGVPTPDAQCWLRNTEELFYRDPPPLSITTITSHIRPDLRATRRNAYQRMFGMNLNHGTDDGQPYPYVKADANNSEFVTTFEEFLREAWVAITNVDNTSGPNPTDRGKIVNLVSNLHDMLMSRRSYGNLSREEFSAVSTMSWFHLTVAFQSPIIQDLRADAASPEQRLFKVAQRVGLPAHALSKSYFDIADPISRILILIETGVLSALPAAPTRPFAPDVQTDLNTIITHWSMITGRDMKASKVAVR